MDEFIINDRGNLFLNKNYNVLYSNRFQNNEIKSLFKNPYEILYDNNENDNDYNIYANPIFDQTDTGGAKNSKKLSRNSYLKIVPSFINVVKGRIIYQGKTKLSLEKIKPVNKKDPIILGTILELSKIKTILEKDSLTKKDISTFIDKFDILPLMYNNTEDKDKDIVFKNKKKDFFNKDSKLCLVTFQLQNVDSFYTEVPSKEVKIAFQDIEDVVKDKNYIVSHYIYDNFFFLVPTNRLKLQSCYMINIKQEPNVFDFKEEKTLNYEPNQRKINLTEVENIVSKAKTYLSTFT